MLVVVPRISPCKSTEGNGCFFSFSKLLLPWGMFMALAIRIVIIVVVIALIILVLRSKLKDGLRVLLIVLFIVVGVLASLFPIERWFIRASTPEEAFAQTVSSGEIMDVIHGKNSCMIYYSTGENSSSVCFFR